jgi:phosphoribosylformylglycinamidine synthase
MTNCLNFASPERPDIMWQFAETVDGIAAASRALGVPVTGGNVSFYNETLGRAILPTPVVGVVGLLEDAERRTTQWFKSEDDVILLLGEPGGQLGGSEYLQTVHGRLAGLPAPLDLGRERAAQAACLAAIEAGCVRSAHDCAEGGLLVALAECAITGPRRLGATVDLPEGGRVDERLFGEAPSRILVTAAPDDVERLTRIAREWTVPVEVLGHVGGDRLEVRVGTATRASLSVEALADAFENGLARALEEPVEALSGRRDPEGAA